MEYPKQYGVHIETVDNGYIVSMEYLGYQCAIKGKRYIASKEKLAEVVLLVIKLNDEIYKEAVKEYNEKLEESKKEEVKKER